MRKMSFSNSLMEFAKKIVNFSSLPKIEQEGFHLQTNLILPFFAKDLQVSLNFLEELNKNRVSLAILTIQQYHAILTSVFTLLNIFAEKKDKAFKKKEITKSAYLVLMFSSSFSIKNENPNKKKYFIEDLKLHPIWARQYLWKQIIKRLIKEDIKRYNQSGKKVGKGSKEEKKIAIAVLMGIKYHMKSFELTTYYPICEYLGKKYYKISKEEIPHIN